MDSKLTDKQQKFVDYLFDNFHEGGAFTPTVLEEAVRQAGYGPTVQPRHVLESDAVKDAIYTSYKKQVALYGLEAFANMLDVMRNPDKKSWRAQLSSSQAVLDASTVPYKNQQDTAEVATGIVVLPAKKKVVVQVEDDEA